jgi:hypothetical protein
MMGAAQQHLDAREQVVHVEWLGDEIVRAQLQRQELVASPLSPGANEDRALDHLFEHTAQHQPVLVGQDEVENDQAGLDLLGQGARDSAGRRLAHDVAARLEHIGQHVRDGGVVFDEEDRRAQPRLQAASPSGVFLATVHERSSRAVEPRHPMQRCTQDWQARVSAPRRQAVVRSIVDARCGPAEWAWTKTLSVVVHPGLPTSSKRRTQRRPMAP